MSHEYSIRYTVEAQTRLEAIEKAVAKMRSTMRLIEVVSADRTTAPYWVVRLQIFEDA